MIKGLYIHIPFCKRICSYCDFAKRVSSQDMMDKYKYSLIKEIQENKNNYGNLETIYIGGGTPSFYPYLKDILIELRNHVDLEKIKEFTIESTLETVLNILPLIKEFKINRISIGVESFNRETLSYINRPFYSFNEVKNIISKLRNEGINNINLDFINGLPFDDIKTIRNNLKIIKELNVDHVSYYDLILENKTKLEYDLKNNRITLPNEDALYQYSKIIDRKLKSFGYKRYEFSNYSKRNKESIHNLLYWNLDEYLGLGLNSHSFISGQRFYNTDSLKEYLISHDKLKEETDINKEYLLVGLRKLEGISISKYKEKFNTELFIDYPFVDKYIKLGLLKIKGDYLSFTNRGINLSNIVFREII